MVHNPAKNKVKVTFWLVHLQEIASTLFFNVLIFFLCSFQKLRPKRNQPWRLVQQRKLAAAANQAETSELAAKLRDTTLE